MYFKHNGISSSKIQCLELVHRDKSFPTMGLEKKLFQIMSTVLLRKWEVNVEMEVRGWI
jgi:hypothetical protein